MQLLDDQSAEALIGGYKGWHTFRRQKSTPNLTINTIIGVVTMVAAPVTISIFDGNPSAVVDQYVDLGLKLR